VGGVLFSVEFCYFYYYLIIIIIICMFNSDVYIELELQRILETFEVCSLIV